MSERVKKQVKLVFPTDLIKEPIVGRLAKSKEFDVMPNIRRARVSDTAGEIVMELEGTSEDLDKGIKFLVCQGVKVELVPGDLVE
jgi:ABC-type methionine transport system ATPase subunit